MKGVKTLNSKLSAKEGDVTSPHSPYSPTLAPSDFYLFGPLMVTHQERRFADHDELKHRVREEL
jgi:hypothetical protein